MKNLSLKILIFSLLILTNSCAEKEDNKLLGQIIGSVAGAYLGSKVGDGIAGNLTTVLGGTVGFLIGGKIVDILDSEEQSELNNLVNQTLTETPDNVSNKWNSQKNIDTNAEITPLNSYQINKNTCRDFTKTVNKGDKQVQEKSTACRDEKGNWKII
jgi:surface antigen